MQTYVIDTNVLLLDSCVLEKFKQKNIYLPYTVIQEIDKHKNDPGSVGYHARKTLLILQELSKKGDFRKGISFGENQSILYITDHNSQNDNVSNDLNIIRVANSIQKTTCEEVTLLSNDRGVHVFANLNGVKCEEYKSGEKKYLSKANHRTVEFPNKEAEIFMSAGMIDGEDWNMFFPNEYFYFDGENFEDPILAQYKEYVDGNTGIIEKKIERVVSYSNILGDTKKGNGISPLNDEQNFLIDSIITNPITICSGKSGSGKTLVSLATALSLLFDNKIFDQLFLVKPISTIGKDVGFLPGSYDEKISVHFSSYMDNLDYIFKSERYEKDGKSFRENPYQYLLDDGSLIFNTVTFLRGRSLNNKIIIVDEVQNMSRHEIKSLITRVGHNSILILLGDVTQRDELYLNEHNNALAIVDSSFKSSRLVGHVYLQKTERSIISELGTTL